MDSILEVKEALVARSKTASLDDLQSQGRKIVKVIRAEHIAAMVQEAVQQAVAASGMMSREEVDQLVERSQHQFKDIVRERQDQHDQFRDTMNELETVKGERVRLEGELAEVVAERDELKAELEAIHTSPTAPSSTDVGSDLVLKLMNEMAELKASQMASPAPAQQPAEADSSVTQALDKIAGALNERLDKFGRKMGISSAVEGDAVKFDALFNQDGPDLESNMDSVHIKKKTEGGIQANLERLKKLKGEG